MEETKIINLKDINEKTPELEQFLLDIAREAGAKSAIMFDGSIKLLNQDENVIPFKGVFGG